MINTVELLFNKASTQLVALKFINKKGKVLLKCGPIDSKWREDTDNYVLKAFELLAGERIIGVKSNSRKMGSACHFDF